MYTHTYGRTCINAHTHTQTNIKQASNKIKIPKRKNKGKRKSKQTKSFHTQNIKEKSSSRTRQTVLHKNDFFHWNLLRLRTRTRLSVDVSGKAVGGN